MLECPAKAVHITRNNYYHRYKVDTTDNNGDNAMYINKTRSNKTVNNVSVEYTDENGQQDIIVISLAALP